MLKVSFKDDFKKVQTFNSKATVVNLTGTVKFPNELFRLIPLDLDEWIFHHPTVEVVDSVVRGWTLKASGTAKCADGDTFNPIVGERIAEAKAKIKLYKFMHTLLYKLYVYYFRFTFGDRYALCNIDKTADYKKPGGIFEEMGKYQALLIKESHHLGKLLEET